MENNYKFVRVIRKHGDKNGRWYFVPQSVEQVKEHFEKIFGKDIKAGVQERVRNMVLVADKSKPDGYWVYNPHPCTPFGAVVTMLHETFGGSWALCAAKLENEVLNNRINGFNKGRQPLYDNGVVETYLLEDDVVAEEVWKDELVYPVHEKYFIEDVRYMKWDMPGLKIKGTHWYAKIGNMDIKDEKGNMKWDTKEEAEKAAWQFVENLNFKRYKGF